MGRVWQQPAAGLVLPLADCRCDGVGLSWGVETATAGAAVCCGGSVLRGAAIATISQHKIRFVRAGSLLIAL